MAYENLSDAELQQNLILAGRKPTFPLIDTRAQNDWRNAELDLSFSRQAMAEELNRRKYERQTQEEQQQKRQDIQDMIGRADPFASQRGQYATQLRDLLGFGGSSVSSAAPVAQPSAGQTMTLADLMKRPNAAPVSAQSAAPSAAPTSADRLNQVIQSNPFFQASQDAGQEAAMRRLRAMGMGASGNAALELQKTAQAGFGDQYFKLVDLLGNLSGARFDPANAANVGLGYAKLYEDQRQFDQGKNRMRTGAVQTSTGQRLSDPWPEFQQPGLSGYWS